METLQMQYLNPTQRSYVCCNWINCFYVFVGPNMMYLELIIVSLHVLPHVVFVLNERTS